VRALSLLLCAALVFATPAFAQDAVDGGTPAHSPDAPVILKKGDAAPADGLFLNEPAAVSAAKRLAAAESERDDLRKLPVFPWWAGLIVVAVSAGLGVGVTVAIYEGTKAKPAP